MTDTKVLQEFIFSLLKQSDFNSICYTSFMRKFVIVMAFFLSGCSVSDYQTIAHAVVSKKPSSVIKSYVKRKKNYYLTHPYALAKDIQSFIKHFDLEVKKFTKAISIWENPKKPRSKTLVKYSNHYKARAIIDFDRGYVRVETIDKIINRFCKKHW